MADHVKTDPGLCPKYAATKCLQQRERGSAGLTIRITPLQLLDLPMDILQAIIKEITHTNDLTSLALTHSILHALVIPHIYSRFDIVWPDAGPTIESRVGVDALTYGLATLVMAQDVFGEGIHQYTMKACEKCGSPSFCQHQGAPIRPRKTRRGNHFARFTRKFSLGNGPEDWVKEYSITKEGGKMLGTLVALAVGRMRNLESFTWDMPTGVLRDVWLALASLEGRDDGELCRLERVWVRWHDNTDSLMTAHPTGGSFASSDLPHLIASAQGPSFRIPAYPRVEFPTFSVLPPLRSLSSLDIDELSYVEEMSVLIERSLTILQELRVSLAHHAQSRLWARPREDRTLVPPPPSSDVGSQTLRRGGFLGILVSRFCPVFSDGVNITDEIEDTPDLVSAEELDDPAKMASSSKGDATRPEVTEIEVDQLGTLLSQQNLADDASQDTSSQNLSGHNALAVISTDSSLPTKPVQIHNTFCKHDQKKLKLEVLELERVYLSMPVLSRAFDWSRLRTLTILSCREHEQLWKTLRREFAPSSHVRSSSVSKPTTPSNLQAHRRSVSGNTPSIPAAEYKLGITRIHTDCVSTSFLAFLKDTLLPDSLEHLFIQQSSMYRSNITIDQIYKHIIRRHRTSLRKLLIDSEVRTVDGSPDGNANWRKWAVNRELITCITSGRMNLRELSIAIDYKDWHYFLQRLPNASNIRSLHISHIADYVHTRIDAREAALQVLDIVALRPELELCYLGIQGKCFEILEYPNNRKLPAYPHEGLNSIPHSHADDDDISDDHDDHDQDNNDSNSDDLNLMTDHEDNDETEDEGQPNQQKVALRLREILFYDDKVSIFKARHGKI